MENYSLRKRASYAMLIYSLSIGLRKERCELMPIERYAVDITDNKKLVIKLGFTPKDNAVDIFIKKYQLHENYCLEIDFGKGIINYGDLIAVESKTTQNFSQSENWVVLECVDRLLSKGYKPQNIMLEKTWSAGHGTSGRLDICVMRDDGSEYLLVECKTYGKEFDKELARMHKDGGQLFTYFKFSNKADIIMLYASELKEDKIVYKNEIILIEDDYRSGDAKDFYDKWNKLTKDNGVFDSWVKPYCFESKALIINDLEDIRHQDSSFIFNRFLEILRHNVVSDKPNAFNKIFTLFLCKIYDEKISEGTDEELGFQWKEGVDDDIKFQLRLTDLYKEGMREFLEKKVTDFSEDEFEQKYKYLDANLKSDIIKDFKKLRLEKNNEFAIKEVYDEKSFKENAKVVKQVVELLQKYKIRYAKKQQYLSDFFELLLTTGLKQESGQFFTPVPIAQFIIKSLPIDSLVETKLKAGKRDELLPYIIDYAAGSGHFITESMHAIQRLLNNFDLTKVRGDAKKFVETARISPFEWALRYIYGIEKDYRLVKVGKVGCYLHGDGLANVIHSDGLSNFKHSDYKGKLTETDKDFPQENKQFDIVVSNPPYSVSSFKNAAREYYKDSDFELYERLTDNSSEIECLFIERTKQLLKDGGVAGVILPSSILNNTGIYTKSREIILQFFDIIAITELGSNTFMATGTNTVVLFLRRRNNYKSINLRKSVDNFFTMLVDVTINGIENPVAKYVNYVWEDISFNDYITLLQKAPNKVIEDSKLYQEYRKKVKFKTDKEFWGIILERENEKLYYFILAYSQKVVLIKSGEKNAEKRFLGYEFSNRRGSAGIHPMQRGKTIDECTQLFDTKTFDNPKKASTYIYKAFTGDFNFPIDESMSENIYRANLVDMMTFDRVDFEKNISLSTKKKIRFESKWKVVKLEDVATTIESGSRPVGGVKFNTNGVLSLGGEHIDNNSGYVDISSPKYVPEAFYDDATSGKIKTNDILICKDGALTGKIAFVRNELLNRKAMANEHLFIVRCQPLTTQKFLFYFLYAALGQELLKSSITGSAQGGINSSNLKAIEIPLPPKDIQTKIVAEIEAIESEERERKEKIEDSYKLIVKLMNNIQHAPYLALDEKLIILNAETIQPENSPNKEYIYVDIDAVENSTGKINLTKRIIGRKAPSRARRLAKSGSTIISTVRPNLKAFAYIGEEIKDCIYSTGFAVFNSIDEKVLLNKWIYLNFMYSNDLMQQMLVAMPKGQYPSINTTAIRNFKIFVPSIDEQKEIVTEIEKHESKIESFKECLSEITALKESVLKKYL